MGALAFLACRRPSNRLPPALDAVVARVPQPLDVELSGCSGILRGPVCQANAGTELRLFVRGEFASPVAVLANGVELPAAPTPFLDGRTLRVVVPADASTLSVRSAPDGVTRMWEVALAPAPPPSPAVAEARQLRKAGKLDAAAELLRAAVERAGTDLAPALSLLARVEFARAHIDEAIGHFRRAVAMHEERGELSSAADDIFALVFLLLERERFGEVRPLLGKAAALSTDWPDGQASVTYNEGLLAWDTGDLRLALRQTREAERHAARLGFGRLRRMATQAIARELLDLGRTQEALTQLRALMASDGDDMIPCDRADLFGNIGWAAARLEAEGGRAAVDPRGPLRASAELLRASCPDPNRVATVLGNVALANLTRGELGAAESALDEAKRAERDPPIPMTLFWYHLRGRALLARHRADAAAKAFASEAAIAAAFGTGEDQRLAAEGEAEARAALGDRRGALGALDAAEALLDARGAFIPLGEGKETFFGTRDRTAALRVSLLVELGRDAEAMTAARRARLRTLAGLRGRAALEHLEGAARGRWEEAFQKYRSARTAMDADAEHEWELSAARLSKAVARRAELGTLAGAALDDAVAVLSVSNEAREPPELSDDELTLLYFPTPHGWYGFAHDNRGTHGRRLGDILDSATPARLGQLLLDPFAEAIARASRIRLLPYGAARHVDLHALPFQGAPLLGHAPVEYALDIGPAPAEAPRKLDALVVADPTSDLPAARVEADAVEAALAHDGWNVAVLRGTDARGEAVRAALQQVNVFHYAGHAEFGGPDGRDSALPLAGGGLLTPGDVLGLPRVPPFVALFGCETGRDTASGASDTLGLSNAFLTAGASGVVATSRAVDDTLARDVALALYSKFVAADGTDIAVALRDAQLGTRAAAPGRDWAAFRAIVR